MGWIYHQPMSIFRRSGSTEEELFMIAKKTTKIIDFVEQDEDFIKQLARDVGCYYCKANERTYSLNKCDSNIHREMGVFAWVHKEDNDCFWVSTRKIWVEEAKAKVTKHRVLVPNTWRNRSTCRKPSEEYNDKTGIGSNMAQPITEGHRNKISKRQY